MWVLFLEEITHSSGLTVFTYNYLDDGNFKNSKKTQLLNIKKMRNLSSHHFVDLL